LAVHASGARNIYTLRLWALKWRALVPEKLRFFWRSVNYDVVSLPGLVLAAAVLHPRAQAEENLGYPEKQILQRLLQR
jgi:hypothetical protein